MNTAIKDVDAYLETQPEEVRTVLEQMRTIIQAAAPDAVEMISYGMPAYKYEGHMLAGFAGWKKHCGFYPWNNSTVEHFKDELSNYELAKGTIRFPLEKPLPVTLIKKIIKFRIKQNKEQAQIKKSTSLKKTK